MRYVFLNSTLFAIEIWSPFTKITFGRLGAMSDFCVQTNDTYEDVVYDDVMQCQKDHEKRCYTTQETVFKSYTVRFCASNYLSAAGL